VAGAGRGGVEAARAPAGLGADRQPGRPPGAQPRSRAVSFHADTSPL